MAGSSNDRERAMAQMEADAPDDQEFRVLKHMYDEMKKGLDEGAFADSAENRELARNLFTVHGKQDEKDESSSSMHSDDSDPDVKQAKKETKEWIKRKRAELWFKQQDEKDEKDKGKQKDDDMVGEP